MGVYDTIYFDKYYSCPICHGKIDSIQVKAFENIFANYHIKDCVSHAEDTMVLKEELFCNNCLKFFGKKIYIVVDRGILIGIKDSLKEGRQILSDLNLEKLVLWYHDQYNKYKKERSKKNEYRKFLKDLREWHIEKLYEKPISDLDALKFTENLSHLGTKDPIESIERFLSYTSMIKVLDELWEEGKEILEIYYPEDMKPGEEKWSVDVYQDDINDRCHMNWTWTVINRKELDEGEEKEDEMPEWEILVDGPFSDDIVKETIQKWLKDRGYEFEVKLIELDDARGSGMVKQLMEMTKEDKYVKLDLDKLIDE